MHKVPVTTLTKFREDNGLSLEAFGLLVGASKGTVHKWENGGIPRRIFMQRIETVTGGKITYADWYSPMKVAS